MKSLSTLYQSLHRHLATCWHNGIHGHAQAQLFIQHLLVFWLINSDGFNHGPIVYNLLSFSFLVPFCDKKIDWKTNSTNQGFVGHIQGCSGAAAGACLTA